MNRKMVKGAILPLGLVTIALFAAIGTPIIFSQQEEGPEQLVQVGFSGEVVYWIHGGRAGSIYPSSTNRTGLVEISSEMRVVIMPQTPVCVQVKLCIELAIANKPVPAGILAYIGSTRMFPNNPTLYNYLAGYVIHPRLASHLEDFGNLTTHTFNWDLRVNYPGTYTIRFFWAVANPAAHIWGRFFSVSVWATKAVATPK